MAENKKDIPETVMGKPLTDDELTEVTGGEKEQVVVQTIGFKRCAADPSHVYVEIHDACPVCGCREFIR